MKKSSHPPHISNMKAALQVKGGTCTVTIEDTQNDHMEVHVLAACMLNMLFRFMKQHDIDMDRIQKLLIDSEEVTEGSNFFKGMKYYHE